MSNKKKKQKSKDFTEKQTVKKAVVLGTAGDKKRTLPWVMIIMCIVFLIVIGGYLFNQFEKPDAVAAAAGNAGNEIVHPVSLFEDGKARHFQVDTENGLTIKYFVLKSSDGVIRAAFDACDVCWTSGKGYVQSGDYMVCQNCGKRFASVKVNEVKGGCNPAPLTRTVVGENLVIQVKDIVEQGSRYFNFSERGRV